MDSNYYRSFTNLLNGDTPVYEESSTINSTTHIENTDDVEVSHRQKRSTNFSKEEDVCIVSAWLNTSKDAIQGGDQKSSRFWKRIYDQFVMNCGERGRTEKSIKQRWGDINARCAKFISSLKQIENMHQSGQTDHGRLEEARKLYAANNNGKQFKFDHCLDILKHERKWLDTCAKNKQPTSTVDNLDGVSIPLQDEDGSSANKDRPLGRKASKEKLKRKEKSSEGGNSSTMLLINERWEEKMALEREKLIQRERFITSHENAKRIDEERIELETMLKDTTGMDEIQTAYWNMKKNEILRKNGLI